MTDLNLNLICKSANTVSSTTSHILLYLGQVAPSIEKISKINIQIKHHDILFAPSLLYIL